MSFLIVANGINRRFGNDVALHGVSFSLPEKGLFCLLGPSGSGKSTLLNIISLVDDGYEGSLLLFGKECRRLTRAKRKQIRLKKIGYVFQSFDLFEADNALSNVLIKADALSSSPNRIKKRKALNLLKAVGLKNKKDSAVSDLSGGEKQRVAIARAMINNPPILLADEPTGALDEKTAHEIFSLLRSLSSSRLVLVVSHDEMLCKEYGDAIIRIGDGRINKIENLNKPVGKKGFELVPIFEEKAKPKMSISFLLGHAFRLLKRKRARSALSVSFIALGLSGIGLSTYITSCINKQVSGVFESYVDDRTLVVSTKNETASPLGNVYSLSYKNALAFKDDFKGFVDDVGSSFIMDFESFFIDDDYFYLQSGSSKIILSNLTTRSINDFLWLDEYESLHVYPSRPAKMDIEEVVVGLPYQNMFSICLQLGINRTYQDLGDFIRRNNPKVVLSASHIDWGFVDEEIFFFSGVVQFDAPCLFHLEHDFNRRVILDKMRFRSTMLDENDDPQYVFEIPYFKPKGDVAILLEELRKRKGYENLVLEPVSNSYLPSLLIEERGIEVERYYLYNADKYGLSWQKLNEISAITPSILGQFPSNPYSFYSSTSSILSGFSFKCFFSNDKEALENVTEAYSFLPLDIAYSPIELPKAVYGASLDEDRGKSLRLSINKESSTLSADEVLLSSSLMDKWHNPSVIEVRMEKESNEVGDYLSREFASGALNVKGYVDSNVDTIFVCDNWTVDFLFSKLGFSMMSLEPSGAVLFYGSKEEAIDSLLVLEREFPELSFSSPMQQIDASINEAVGYIGEVVNAFSIMAFVSSILLFSIVMYLSVLENEKEIKTMHLLGLCDGDIEKSFICHGLILSFFSLLFSDLIVLLSQSFVGLYLNRSFGSSSISISFEPFLVMALFSISFFVIFCILLRLFIRKRLKKV